jgi:hypothetical protein
MAGGYLGGHLSFARGVNVNRTAWQDGPAQWTPVLASSELTDGDHRTVQVDGVPILLYRSAGRLHALANTCSHMGGPLDEGSIEDGCVTARGTAACSDSPTAVSYVARPRAHNRITRPGSSRHTLRCVPRREAGSPGQGEEDRDDRAVRNVCAQAYQRGAHAVVAGHEPRRFEQRNGSHIGRGRAHPWVYQR